MERSRISHAQEMICLKLETQAQQSTRGRLDTQRTADSKYYSQDFEHAKERGVSPFNTQDFRIFTVME